MTVEAHGQVLSTSRGTILISGNNIKGAWVELVASTGIDCEWLEVFMFSTQTDLPFLVDIGVGAAASEVAVVSNITFWGNVSKTGDRFRIPIHIPAGSRISARQEDNSAAGLQCWVDIHISDNADFGTSQSNITIGTDFALVGGQAVDCGGTLNTKGAYTQIVASTSQDMDYLVVMFGPNDNNGTPDAGFLIDVAIGAASSEVVLLPNIAYLSNTQETPRGRYFEVFESIPAGSRVAVRGQCSTIDATDRIFDCSIIGALMDAAGGGGGAPKQAGRGGGMAG